MTDFTLIKTAAEHAIKAKGTLLAEAAQSNYDGLVTPESVLALIAENKELGRYLCTCRDCGGEGALHTGDWHSYSPMEPPEPVMEKCGECDGTGLIGTVQDLHAVIEERDQLKAENEALRRGMKGDYDLDAWLDWAKEAEALRKDAERLSWLDNRSMPVVEGQSMAQPEGELWGYEWTVAGQCSTVREAIDDAIDMEEGK